MAKQLNSSKIFKNPIPVLKPWFFPMVQHWLNHGFAPPGEIPQLPPVFGAPQMAQNISEAFAAAFADVLDLLRPAVEPGFLGCRAPAAARGWPMWLDPVDVGGCWEIDWIIHITVDPL